MSKHKVPFSNVSSLNESLHRQSWERSLAEVLETGSPILGQKVAEFESNLSNYLGVEDAVGVANGTDALAIAMISAGVMKGDKVAAVANAGGYSSVACNLIGANIVYVDVDENCQMSPESLERVLSQAPNISAVILTHLYGFIGQIESIVEICRKHSLTLIEDCAQAIGSETTSGSKAGSLGDVSTFSFYPTKNLGALGDGGAIVTNKPAVAEKAKSLRQYGWSERFLALDSEGRNSRLDEFQASGLNLKLATLDEENGSRVETWGRYRDALQGNKSVTLIGSAEGNYNGHLCVIYSSEIARHQLIDHFEARGIQTLIHYPYPDYEQPGLSRSTSIRHETTTTDWMSQKVLSLPLHAHMQKAAVDQVIEALKELPGGS